MSDKRDEPRVNIPEQVDRILKLPQNQMRRTLIQVLEQQQQFVQYLAIEGQRWRKMAQPDFEIHGRMVQVKVFDKNLADDDDVMQMAMALDSKVFLDPNDRWVEQIRNWVMGSFVKMDGVRRSEAGDNGTPKIITEL